MHVPPPNRCIICGDPEFIGVFHYSAPPKLEIRFEFAQGEEYRRTIYTCATCGHFMSVHKMDDSALYSEDYVSANYGDRLRATFERIINLDPAKSDNEGRVQRIVEYASSYLPVEDRKPTALDVGSGLCVFLHRLKREGWEGTALDPDARAAQHAREVVGVDALCGDFMNVTPPDGFDLVTFNKVLEHVPNPVHMLARARAFLRDTGFVYVEVPDAECAALDADGPDREEFCIDHPHVFSAASLAITAARAGFHVRRLERLQEPSTKYTLFAFLTPHTAPASHRL